MGFLRRSFLLLALILGLIGAITFFSESEQAPAPPPDEPRRTRPGPIESGPALRLPVASEATQQDGGERRRLVLLNNEAAECLEAGDLERAVELLEECHAALPEEEIFLRNLAEALTRLARRHYDERRLERAVEALERVLGLAPDREDADALREILARWRLEAKLAGGEKTDASRYFELTYDASREDVLHRSGEVLAVLESAYGFLRDWFQFDPVIDHGRAPIRVVIYAPRTFDEVTGLGDWAGGAFDGTVRISVADLERESERWRRVARHELAHAFLQEVGGASVPGWMNEGIAQWLEGGDLKARVAQARERLAGVEPFALERLRGSLASWQERDEIERAYAQTLALTDHLVQHYGEDVLRRMVRSCGEGEDPAVSFEAATGVPLDFVVQDLSNYLR